MGSAEKQISLFKVIQFAAAKGFYSVQLELVAEWKRATMAEKEDGKRERKTHRRSISMVSIFFFSFLAGLCVVKTANGWPEGENATRSAGAL